MLNKENTKLPPSAEHYLINLEMRCADAVEEKRYYCAEFLEHEYSGALGILEALGMISHTDYYQCLNAMQVLRYGEPQDCLQERSEKA